MAVIVGIAATACQPSDTVGVLNTCSFAIEADADVIDTFSGYEPSVLAPGEGVGVADVGDRAIRYFAKARPAGSNDEFLVWQGPYEDLQEPTDTEADYDREVVVSAEICAMLDAGGDS